MNQLIWKRNNFKDTKATRYFSQLTDYNIQFIILGQSVWRCIETCPISITISELADCSNRMCVRTRASTVPARVHNGIISEFSVLSILYVLKLSITHWNTANIPLTNFLNAKLTFPIIFSRCCSPFDVPANAPSIFTSQVRWKLPSRT